MISRITFYPVSRMGPTAASTSMKNHRFSAFGLAFTLIALSGAGCVANTPAPVMDGKMRVNATLVCTDKGIAISFALVNGANGDETMPDAVLPWARDFIATHLEIKNLKTGEIIKGSPPISDHFGATTIPAHGTLQGQVRLNFLFDLDKILSLEKDGGAMLLWTYSGKTRSGLQVDANG